MTTINQNFQATPEIKLTDGPKYSPLLQLIQWIFNPLKFLDTCNQRYGDIFTVKLAGLSELVVISHPQGIQELFTANPKFFDCGKSNRLLEPTLGENSLLLLDGDRHQRQRQLLMPSFHGERMKAYGKIICDITQQVVNKWEIGKPFSLRPELQEISLRVILQAVFGLDEGQQYQELKQLLNALLELTGTPLGATLLFFPALQRDLGSWSPGRKFKRLKQQIDTILYTEIKERRSQPNSNHTDILSLLMSARDESGQPMTDVELRDELITLLFAGHETTATSISWALYWIHRLPEIQQKLSQELDSIGNELDINTIAKLPYLNAVCQETLRLNSVTFIAFPRLVNTSFKLMGYEFEPGTRLTPCIYLTHQRPDLYPEPKQFKPERFLERQFSAYEYIPFGGSNRRCIGMAFAMFEMKLVIATILKQHQLKLADNSTIKSVRRGVTIAPSKNLSLVAIS